MDAHYKDKHLVLHSLPENTRRLVRARILPGSILAGSSLNFGKAYGWCKNDTNLMHLAKKAGLTNISGWIVGHGM
jgi:hypothetical protein